MVKLTRCTVVSLTLLVAMAAVAGEFREMTADSQTFSAYFEAYDGDEWLLIGRGRNNWEFDTDGQGSANDVSQDLGTTNAFAPAAYSDTIVNDLLSQASLTFPSNVTMRVMRATSIDGTGTYQDSRWTDLGGASFSFDLDPGFSVTHTIMNPDDTPVNEGSYTSASTTTKDNFHQGAGDTGARLFTFNHETIAGFRYGSSPGVTSSTAADSFLYGSWPAPYTEVYIAYEIPPLPGDITFSNTATTAITTSSAMAGAVLSTNATELILFWDLTDQRTHSTTNWAFSHSAGSASAGAVSVQATNLQPDTSYTWRLYATNDVASTFGWSSADTFITAFSAAQAPAFTNATPVGDTIKLGWQDHALHETAYVLLRSDTGSGGPYSEIATLPRNTTRYQDGGRAAGLDYSYRLAATNANNGSATDFALCQTNATAIGADSFGPNAGPSGIVSPMAGTINPATGISWAFGDTYHLVFITSTTTNLIGDHPMPYWNRHANTVADGSSLPGVPEASWYTLASTHAVDARDNAVVSAPVYLVNGSNLVASGYADMWDESIASRITIDESGAGGASGNLWTGSQANGTKSGRPLDVYNASTQAGAITGSGNWFANREYAETDNRRFYVMSQPLMITNGAPDTTPPSPTNITFAAAPVGLTDESVEMYATVAHDLESTPVEYYFENRTTGGNSGWQLSSYWVDDVPARAAYTYRVKARDAVSNETAWSEERSSSPVVYGQNFIPAPTGEHPIHGEAWQIGDTYHLMFTTSTTTNLVDNHGIDYWNAYVNSVADGSSVTGMAEQTWFVLASATNIAARDNAVVSAPVYLIHPIQGVLMVASNYNDMWDGSILNRGWDENLGVASGEIWSGSQADGTRHVNYEIDAAGTTVRSGNGTGSWNWFANRTHAETDNKRFYALSAPIEIVNPPPPAGSLFIVR
jgi:hypothetical protein